MKPIRCYKTDLNRDNLNIDSFSINQSQKEKPDNDIYRHKIGDVMLLTLEEVRKLEDQIEEANLLGEKDLEASLNIYLRLWNELPEPKAEQPEEIAKWLNSCVFTTYFYLGNYIEAKKWALLSLEYHTTDYDDTQYMMIGMATYELNELDESFKYFDMAYKIGKKRAFQGSNKKYWEFYSKHK